jgi:hypothetical protein
VLTVMRTAKRNLVITVLLGLAGTGTVVALTRPGPAAEAAVVPAAEQPPIEGNWIPNRSGEVAPSAFPDLMAPQGPGNLMDYGAELARLCPRLFGDAGAVTIEPTDDNYRRLLKARLHQGRLEVRDKLQLIQIGNWMPEDYIGLIDCLEDMRAAAQELWANDPKTLVPWLEEFVICAKEFERVTAARVRTGTVPPYALNLAQRYRLKVEAALWKAKAAAGRR